MEIFNSTIDDIPKIFELYRIATAYMKSKNQVSWPEFPIELVQREIEEKRQWKLMDDNEISCIWATTLDDALIWGKRNQDPAVYIHRIATNLDFRGQGFVQTIVSWAQAYCRTNDLRYIRLDTVGLNEGLIKHYGKHGFEFLGTAKLKDTHGLPDHYNDGDVCLFQINLKEYQNEN